MGSLLDLMPAPLVRHKLTVHEYEHMIEVGILGKEDRVELVEGEVIAMAPVGSDHAWTVNDLTELLVFAARGRGIVAVQNPVTLEDRMPQPDFAV